MLLNQLSSTFDYRNDTITSRYEAVEKVILTIHERLDEPLSLQAMAEIVNLSPYHFNRIFRQIIGIPPSQFLYAQRIETAKRILLTTQLSISDVCYAVGYNSLGTFTTRFTQLVGLSPRHFRHFATQFTPSYFDNLYSHVKDLSCTIPADDGFTGCVKVSKFFSGVIFVGLFSKPIPQNQPTSCTLLTTPGTYWMTPVPDGCYYIFAAALNLSEDPLSYLLTDTALQGTTGPLIVRDGKADGYTEVTLRPKQLTDPPLLIALPFLLTKFLATHRFSTRDILLR